MTKEKWYRLVYDVLRPIGALLYPQKFYGLENIPEGPAILCAPHSNVADPILISFALGRKTYVHHLAKVENDVYFRLAHEKSRVDLRQARRARY